MMKAVWRWGRTMPASHVWMMLAIMLVTGPIAFAASWWWQHQPPIIVYDQYEEDAVATSGGELDLIVTKLETAACVTDASRWLWRYDPDDPLPPTHPQKRKQWREITSTPHAPPSVGRVTTYRLVVPLPPNIEPGEWHYQAQAVDRCGGPISASPRFSRDIPIRITASADP